MLAVSPPICLHYHWTHTERESALFQSSKTVKYLKMLIIKTNIIKFRVDSHCTLREISIDKKRKLAVCSALEGKVVSL